jgi:hypothetical protein
VSISLRRGEKSAKEMNLGLERLLKQFTCLWTSHNYDIEIICCQARLGKGQGFKGDGFETISRAAAATQKNWLSPN